MFLRRAQLAELMHQPKAAPSIELLAPAYSACVFGTVRGYTNARQHDPTAASQGDRGFCLVGVGLPVAWYVVRP